MMRLTPDWIGWLATFIFLASYNSKDQGKLRRLQALAAVLWVVYGAILHAVPIVVANLLVAGVALYSSFNRASARDPSRIS
jgi:inner membrane protein